MKLVSIEVKPRGVNGWRSKKLIFGSRLTQLYGPNGCGKTPLLKMIIFCLGWDSQFRKIIKDKCQEACLTIRIKETMYVITRELVDTGFAARIESGGEVEAFSSSRAFSDHIFHLFGCRVDNVVSRENTSIRLYINTLLPLFYLSEEHGYAKVYAPPGTFIKDQYSESIRLAFGLPAKHLFDKKKEEIFCKKQQDILDKAIVKQEDEIKSLANQLDTHMSKDEMLLALTKYKARMRELKTNQTHQGSEVGAIDDVISEQLSAVRRLEIDIGQHKNQRNELNVVRGEIEAEIKVLNLNEESRAIFTSFDTICGRENCGLFLASKVEYGKNLLYLKDQIKDLDFTSQSIEGLIESKEIERLRLLGSVNKLTEDKKRLEKEHGISEVIDAVSELTKNTLNLQRSIANIEHYDQLRGELANLIDSRSTIQDRLASLKPDKNSNIKLIEYQEIVRKNIIRWLDIMGAKNVSRPIKVNSDFTIIFGDEKIRQYGGSTLVRIILAINASIYEACIIDPGNPFRFFILDTPKQQEIDIRDFEAYVVELSNVARKYNGQIIFSSKEYQFSFEGDDQEWNPSFEGKEQLMMLGSNDPH